MRRTISPALFAVAVACFFLPFVTISCNQQLGQQIAGDLQEQFGGDTNLNPTDTEETLTERIKQAAHREQ